MHEIGAPGENKIFDRAMMGCFHASRQHAKNQNQSKVEGGLVRGLCLFIQMLMLNYFRIFHVSFEKLCGLKSSVIV